MFCGYKLREYATFTESSWNIKHGLTFFIEVEYLFYQLLDTRGVKISVEDPYQSLGLMRRPIEIDATNNINNIV